MNKSANILINAMLNYKKAFALLNGNLLKLLSMSFADIITIYVSLFTLSLFSAAIEQPLYEFLINLPNPAAVESNSGTIITISFILLYAVIYLLLTFLQPISWKIAFGILGIKHTYKKIMRHILLTNLFLILFIAAINLYHDLFTTLNKITGITAINSYFLQLSYIIMMLLALYLLLVSYSTLFPFRKSVLFAAKNFAELLIPFILILLTFAVIHLIMAASFYLHPYFNIVLGFVLFLPSLSFARIYFMLSVK